MILYIIYFKLSWCINVHECTSTTCIRCTKYLPGTTVPANVATNTCTPLSSQFRWRFLGRCFTWWVPSTPMSNEIYCFYSDNRMEYCNSWSRNTDSTTGNLYSINCCASSHPCQTQCQVLIAATRHCPPAKDCRGASPWFVGTCWKHPTRQCEWWRHFWWSLFFKQTNNMEIVWGNGEKKTSVMYVH